MKSAKLTIPALATLLGLFIVTVARAEVARPAPDLVIPILGNASMVKEFDGQPIVVLFAKDERSGAFRKQLKRLEEDYRYFAGRDAVFVAAIANPTDRPVPSNIPFMEAAGGAAAAEAYGIPVGDFAIAVIGPDGNLDMLTQDIVSGDYIRGIMDNTYEVQAAARD